MTSDAGEQLPLLFGNYDYRLDSLVKDPHLEVANAVEDFAQKRRPGLIYLWGGSGVGKTHLLQAACAYAAAANYRPAYLPLSRAVEDLDVEICDGLESVDLIAIDDVQSISKQSDWEEALFALFNRLWDAERRIIVSADKPPTSLAFNLNDLSSRLSWGITFNLRNVDDTEKLGIMQAHARDRGFQLPEETGKFLIDRAPRDLGELCGYIAMLDHASLARQRKLTIPFVKEILKL